MTSWRDGEMRSKDSSTVNFDDQEWDFEDGTSRPQPEATGAWKVVAGVAVGIVIGGALMWAVAHREGRPGAGASQSVAEAAQPVAESAVTAARAPMLRLPDEPTRSGTPMPPLTPSAASAASAAGLAPSQGAGAVPGDTDVRVAPVQRTGQQTAERKERAWALFYRKPAACEESPPRASMVECANDFIRAKREFEQLYAEGKPPPVRPAVSASRSTPGP
jgi:hypothetical protein